MLRAKQYSTFCGQEGAWCRGSCLTSLLLHWAPASFPHQLWLAWASARVLPEALRRGSGLPVHNSSDSLPWGSSLLCGLCRCGLESAQPVFLQEVFHVPRQTSQTNTGTSTKTGEWCLSSQCSSWTFCIWAAWVLCPLPSYMGPELSHFHTNLLFHHAQVWLRHGIKIITLPSTTPFKKVKVWQSWSNLSGHLKITATKSLPKKWHGNLQDETFLNMISRKLFNVTSFNQINCLLFN